MGRLMAAAVALVALALMPAGAGAQTTGDPPFGVPVEQLAAAFQCPAPFTNPEHEPVLLVHGTFTNGHENFGWNWELLLPSLGYDYFLFDYPERGLGDMHTSA